jgi:hypothetical protein
VLPKRNQGLIIHHLAAAADEVIKHTRYYRLLAAGSHQTQTGWERAAKDRGAIVTAGMSEPWAWKFEVSTISPFESARPFTMSTPRMAKMMESRTIAQSSTACKPPSTSSVAFRSIRWICA